MTAAPAEPGRGLEIPDAGGNQHQTGKQQGAKPAARQGPAPGGRAQFHTVARNSGGPVAGFSAARRRAHRPGETSDSYFIGTSYCVNQLQLASGVYLAQAAWLSFPWVVNIRCGRSDDNAHGAAKIRSAKAIDL